MATVKISQLPAITGANTATTDVLAIVDTSLNITNKITREEFFKNVPAIDVTGTVTADGLTVDGNITADGLTVDGDISSTGGDLNLDTLDLNAIAASKAVTAVDVFVYDTSRDSDGGAWRKRTQHTSWYNETLNTATRGSRREFPAVAVIVAEAAKVTIYDGDDPALPMWMVFSGATANLIRAFASSISALNGLISVGQNSGNSLNIIDLIADGGRRHWSTSQFSGFYLGGISERNAARDYSGYLLQPIVNTTVNDVAMTVLPDAPIDPATGLPVPTIAVATAGGISVIRDDGNVWDITNYAQAPATVEFVDIAGTQRIITQSRYTSWSIILDIPTADIPIFTQYFNRDDGSPLIGIASHYASTGDDILVGKNTGLVRVLSEPGIVGLDILFPDLRCDMKSTYNTGWMPGDIKGAFLSDTDDTDLVASGELVTNGTFDTDTTGWTPANATLSVVSNKLQISSNAAGGAAALQTLSGLTVGQTYILSGTAQRTSGSQSAYVSLYTGTGTFVANAVVATGTEATGTLTFVASQTSMIVRLQILTPTASGETAVFDNISVKLADADRSVNNRGLIVNGTVVRSPVATGADLVAYSGFSASNYLEQPYNSALDFGTGDFSVMGWHKGAAISGNLITRWDGVENIFFQVFLEASQYRFRVRGGSSDLAVTGGAAASNTWNHFCGVRASGVLSLFVNGVLIGTVTGSTANVSDSNATLRIGLYQNGGGALTGSLALLRISATAPTAEQIYKIYNDEKFLFQDNAQATLYGASDAVTALAHDPVTDLLHVGTSAGRSVFSGLRRVSNTANAVTTAISAQAGLVVEE